ncbi:DUF1516 family protein [Halalkalibacter krulwichiae]|uniref:UPF0344 protein BkAM31D_17800 n=1 Tax=Halalkalibacter krulwichiae TaxID=199441 RepID=A0A1X9MDM4_9BACI|nr:DUF1516 family protein [Halalkalibacter krulwichiae]ARK31545.1 hypothetical protein BkAM31D_17800 [Halalkalibacter krulwichiae]
MVTGMYHAHVDSWWLTILLFVIAYFLLKAGKQKGAKIVHMILRLFYVIMIFSGVTLLISLQFPFVYVLKGILALVLIYAIEMILVKTKKGTIGSRAPMYWGLFALTLVLVVLLGMGIISF